MVIREVRERTLVEFVREQVATGYTALSRVVSPRIDLSIGRFFLIVPEGSAPERVENWGWDPGHVDARAADGILAHLIAVYLQTAGNRVLIQDFLAKRSDPRSIIFASPEDDPLRVFYGEEMYWELQRSDLAEDKIAECIGDASYWPWLAYFGRARTGRGKLVTDGYLAGC